MGKFFLTKETSTIVDHSVVVYRFQCLFVYRKLSRTIARMSRKRSVRRGGTYVCGWDCYVEVTNCLLSSAVSLFDHLHDCYVEYTQNYTDKSFDKVCMLP